MSSSDREPAAEVEEEGVLAFLLAIRATAAHVCAFFFFFIFARIFGAGRTFESLFLIFCRVCGSEKQVHSVHRVHHRLERSILPSKLAKNKIWRRNYWEPMAQFVVE